MKFLVLLLIAFLALFAPHGSSFEVGVGIADVTGPAGEIIMMGYANIGQDARGIHTRTYSRAYIFVDPANEKRVVFVSADVAFFTQNLKVAIIKQLAAKYGSLYTAENVALSGTHTHSAPGGYADKVLFLIPTLGYSEESANAIVDGVVESIISAHENIKPAKGFLNSGDLVGANINRSPYAYEQNPEAERALYAHDTDVLMTLLKIVGEDGEEMGLINWFSVHPTAMWNVNHLISSDNKGAASLFFEALKNGEDAIPGQGPFVAAFASTNLGDVSPNTRGAFCTGGRRPGLRCDYQTSTCPNFLGRPVPTLCHGEGPAQKDYKENTRTNAYLQYEKARELYDSAVAPLAGSIDYRHLFVYMPNVTVDIDGQQVKLCHASMGYSFAAGTTDGPGFFLFKQGSTTENPYWDAVRDFIKEPSEETIKCQAPKPIFFATGEMNFPHEWQSSVLDLQLLKIGNLVIIVVPGELTTMAGRRLRDAVRKVLFSGGAIPQDSHVVIAGLSNTYGDYFATFEEYQVQRYEGASTIYGPNTLSGLIQEYGRLAQAIVSNSSLPAGPSPPANGRLLSFIPEPREDTLPDGVSFGSILNDVEPSYNLGSIVKATFWAANPRNSPQRHMFFMTIERNTSGQWETYRTDGNWDTEFHWEGISARRDPFQSHAQLIWDTAYNAQPGTYRLKYQGHSRDAQDLITPFVSYSSIFSLI